jgi:hypothetical protein
MITEHFPPEVAFNTPLVMLHPAEPEETKA